MAAAEASHTPSFLVTSEVTAGGSCKRATACRPRYGLPVDGAPSSVRNSTDDVEVPDPEVDARQETRADRIRRRIADHRVGALLLVGVALLGAIGGAIGGVREIIDLFDGSPEAPPAKRTAVSFDPSELKTAKNARYGFSFQYPATWERQDPVNGDGLAASGPEPGLELVGYGALPTIGPSPADTFNRLDYQVRQLTDGPGTRLVEGPSQQNVTRFLPGGETTEVAGSRFVRTTDPTSEEPALTSVGLTTTTSDRDVTMLCQVPTRLYSSYRGACNQFISTLTLTR
jgi:hypothetical protein